MNFDRIKDLPGYLPSQERREESRNQMKDFSNFLDKLTNEIRVEIEDLSWDIADEITERHNTSDGWFGDIKFKRKLERMLKRYLSGFNRDEEGLMQDELISSEDRVVAEVAFVEAQKHLSKFAELEFIPEQQEPVPDEEIDSSSLIGTDFENESFSTEDNEIAEEEKNESVWTPHSKTILKEDESTTDSEAVSGRVKERGVWEPNAPQKASEQEQAIAPEETQEERLERLNQELEIIKEEMSSWEVNSTHQFGQAVDVLVQHGMSVKDSLHLVGEISNLKRWDKAKAIQESMLVYSNKGEKKNSSGLEK